MPSLYNCKHSGDQYRITKFTSDFEVEASYLCDTVNCECPAGHRPKCRHREMLPKFIARNAVGTEWFYDHDRGGWVQGWKEESTNDPYAMETNPNDKSVEDNTPSIASEALPIQPTTEPSPDETENIDWDRLAEERLGQRTKTSAKASDSERVLDKAMGADADSWQKLEDFLRPSPSPTIRRRV